MKPSEVIPAVLSTVATAASPAAVIRNDRTEAVRRTIEDKLRTALHGFILEVDPLAGASAKDVVKRGAFSAEASIIMRLRLNTQCAPAGVTGDTMLDTAYSIIRALLAAQLGAYISGPFLDELADDTGLITYQITATVTTQS